MAIALVNSASYLGGGPLTTVAAPATSHTAANLLVVIVGFFDNSITVSSIADTAGNNYTFITRKQVAGIGTIEIWYAKNIAGNANNIVTATLSATASSRAISVHQYSGCDNTAPYDVSNVGTGNATAQTTAAAQTNIADEVIVAGYYEYDVSAVTAGANFTIRQTKNYFGTEDRIVSVTGSYGSAATTATASNYIGVHATFKKAAGAFSISCNAGSYSKTGQAASLRAARKIAASQASYALTGQSVGLKLARKIPASVGSYLLTGQDIVLRAIRKMAAGGGSYTLTGQAANLVIGQHYILVAEAGCYGEPYSKVFVTLDGRIYKKIGNTYLRLS
jgi:hypothetical protein